MESENRELVKLFKEHAGCEPASMLALPLSGSDRRYFRMTYNNESVLGVFNPKVQENKAYIEFTRHFKQNNVSVPDILSVSADGLYYLVEDIGNDSLYNRVIECNGKLTDVVLNLYKNALEELVKMQLVAGSSIDYSYCYPVKKFERTPITWDLNYFKYNYLKLTGIEFDEYKLQADFDVLIDFLATLDTEGFMFRDFQSRNILLKNGAVYFIDFQGGMEGPICYDAASLLFQAKAQIPNETRKELFDFYCKKVQEVRNISNEYLKKSFYGFALQRTLQVLGAYGFRGYYERKPHFIQSIPYAIENLKFLLNDSNVPVSLPYLKELASILKVPKDEVFAKVDKLTVRVTSFSYKKGYPVDPSGNGGGFVFDCRGIDNPGRYNEYKSLTGRDNQVIEFFKSTGIDEFVENVIKVTELTVENYIERKFDHLSVSFGCTGGQHRSVYSAEAFAKYIVNKYDIKVVLWHREQDIFEEYE